MASKKRKKKAVKVAMALSHSDVERLRGVARQMRVPRAVAARRLMHEALKSHAIPRDEVRAKNQLSLFDTMQYDITGGLSRTQEGD